MMRISSSRVASPSARTALFTKYASFRRRSPTSTVPATTLPPSRLPPPAGVRQLVSAIESGHIAVGKNEGTVYINNIFPRKLQWLLRGPLRGSQLLERRLEQIDKPHLAASSPWSIIRQVFPADLSVEIKQVIPRFNEGGAFVKFSHSPNIKDTEIEDAIRRHLEEHPIKPWFSPFQKVDVGRVVGSPWIEDLYRIPSQRLKVEFLPTAPENSAVSLTTEGLYTLLRKYGMLRDIQEQPLDSKALPKYAFVEFARLKNAAMAKNCLHGYIVPEQEGGGKTGTQLKLRYERILKISMIKEWVASHPRLVIPAVAALIAAITVIIFDPIRTFMIELKVKAGLQTEQSPTLQRLHDLARKASPTHFRPYKGDDRGLAVIWEGRQNDISTLQSWLTENIDTFIVVCGPRGSGKRELVLDEALEQSKYKVVVDCKQIQDAKGDAAKIATAATEVGYRPVFSWLNNVSSFIDLATQGMIGTKTGFIETLDVQLSKIWQRTSSALKNIALESRGRDDKDAYLTDDEYLEAHPEKRPVVVIDNFLHNAVEDNTVYDKILEWGAELVTSKVAHVIFLTTDVSFSKTLSKALPNQVFRTISLGDCSLEVGRRFVLSHLQKNDGEQATGTEDHETTTNLHGLDNCIETLGGRITDLEFMAHRIKTGESPQAATNRIIEQAVFETLKIFLLEADTTEHAWTREQAWHLIKEIANSKDGTITYNKVLLSDLFKNGEASIRALEQAELIFVTAVNGYPYLVKPSRPVLRTVFKRITENKALRSRLDLSVLAELIKRENDSIKNFEEELRLLEAMHKQPRELYPRISWLLQKVYNSQAKIGQYEGESALLQTALKGEH